MQQSSRPQHEVEIHLGGDAGGVSVAGPRGGYLGGVLAPLGLWREANVLSSGGLCVQDSTELDYTTRRASPGWGHAGDGHRAAGADR
ncbi:MAG: hypothetical protein U1F70_06695 [Candidatus Competibacteraceae bacterium]